MTKDRESPLSQFYPTGVKTVTYQYTFGELKRTKAFSLIGKREILSVDSNVSKIIRPRTRLLKIHHATIDMKGSKVDRMRQ